MSDDSPSEPPARSTTPETTDAAAQEDTQAAVETIPGDVEEPLIAAESSEPPSAHEGQPENSLAPDEAPVQKPLVQRPAVEQSAVNTPVVDTPVVDKTVNPKESQKVSPRYRLYCSKHWKGWLNSSFISVGGTYVSMVQYLNMTNYSDPRYSWWDTTLIEFALSTLKEDHKRFAGSVFIADTWHAEVLYVASKLKDDELETHKDFNSAAIDELKANFKDIVIIPVNDSYGLDSWATGTGPRDPGAPRPQDAPDYTPGVGVGMHWSFIVIDKSRNKARYVDPAVTPGKGSKGQAIPKGIDANGPIAGKILCGFDELVQPDRKGQFSAKTLIYTPNQFKNNACKDDPGACGPFFYESLDWLLRNKQFIDNDLDKTFKRGHKRKMNFDSRTSRKKLRDKLWEQRQADEAEHPEIPPLNLTPEVAKELRSKIQPDDFEAFYKIFAAKTKVSTTQPQSKPQPDPKSSEDESGSFGNGSQLSEAAFNKQQEKEHASRRLAKLRTVYDEKIAEGIIDITWEEFLTIEGMDDITQEDTTTAQQTDSTGPANVDYDETVNFTHLPESEINRWVESSKELLGKYVKKDEPEWQKKAVLQRVFGGGFNDLSPGDVVKWREGHSEVDKSWDDENTIDAINMRLDVEEIKVQDARGQ
jgi:hypothetical protein